jgi:predicted permease
MRTGSGTSGITEALGRIDHSAMREHPMDSLLQDVKFGIRLLWKDKGFALTAIATLALCIAANTAVFSIVHAVVLKPLPLPDPDRILTLYNSYPNVGVKRASNGVPDFYDRRRALTALEDVAMYNNQGLTVGEKGSVRQLEGLNVTPSFFRLLRAKPELGRIFDEDEGELGKERKIILSHALWQELFGGDKSVIGKDLRIYGNPFTIVGVMPRDFFFLEPRIRLWRPLAFRPEQREAYHSNSWEMIGRLKQGETIERVAGQLDALNKANLDRIPQFRHILINAGFHTKVLRLQDEVVKDIRRTLFLLWGGVLFVLLIGAVNIVNLALARASVRVRELATRFAVGAGRWRMTRQLLTESVILTGAGSVAGLLLGWWGLRIVDTLRLNRLPRGSEIAVDSQVVGFILLLALGVSILIAVAPLLHTFRVDLPMALRAEGRTGTSARGTRAVRNALVITQIAFALVLLAGAGLLLSSFRHVLAVKPGFAAAGVLTGSVALPSARYRNDTELVSFARQSLERIRALPGVAAAGMTTIIPFGDSNSDSVIMAEGYVPKPGESLISPSRSVVSTGYFEAMRVPLIEGRLFDSTDAATAPKTIIVDQRLARKFWPDSSPIGKRMWQPQSPEDLVQPTEKARWYRVVGVVGSVKLRALVDPDERAGAYYFPWEQGPADDVTFAIRTAGDPSALVPALRRAVVEVDPELPVFDLRTMEERISESLISRKSPLLLALGFAVVAVFLAGIGIYGVLAYTVAQRRREIGIRMALGSSSEGIFRLIAREGLLLLAFGFTLGFAGTAGLSRYVESVLFGVRPLDPAVLAAVAGILAAVAVSACLLPAQRAARVDPITALRE